MPCGPGETASFDGIKCFKQWKVNDQGMPTDSLGRPLLLNCRRRMPHKCGPKCPFRRDKKEMTKEGKIIAITKYHKKEKEETLAKSKVNEAKFKIAAAKRARAADAAPAAEEAKPTSKPVQNSPVAKRSLDMNDMNFQG